ncbi:MAG: Flp pilus assembly complex ATPase component TadA, partial [Candidatus Hydrogenedentes bacterium]|nr:Flp pilus assembly complex ATPase component TadA [Candidatus Hydrogenedentota bacterium]
ETAKIAIRAAMTGHLVFSTLHTNDAPEAISTLRNMAIPPFLIGSALTAIIGQRLVRKNCKSCTKSFKPNTTLLKSIGLPASVKKLYRGKGCQACHFTGNSGRTGIFEVFEVTPGIRERIAKEDTIKSILKTAKFTSMATHCRSKVKSGLISPEEYLRVIRL